MWAAISGDPELGHVYLPIEDPTGDDFSCFAANADNTGASAVLRELRKLIDAESDRDVAIEDLEENTNK